MSKHKSKADPSEHTLSGPTGPTLLQQIQAARRAGVPIVAVGTPDPATTMTVVRNAVITARGAEARAAAVLVWDIVRGLKGMDEASSAVASTLAGDPDPTRGNPLALFEKLQGMPEYGVCCVHLAHRWLVDPMVLQAVWNLRDRFKANHRMAVLMAPAFDGAALPAELSGDVVLFDEPLPAPPKLREIIEDCVRAADVEQAIPADQREAVLRRSVEAIQGLPAFQAEQVVAMSLTARGIDVPNLWERKRRQIELTAGLKVSREQVGFDDIGGVPVIKEFLEQVVAGNGRPNAIVFIDEIEKHLAGAGGAGGPGDTSGVTQDQLGALLSYMQDQSAAGLIFVGPPGSAKSLVAKAAGTQAGIPTIQLDLGALKGSLVGQSESNLRAALKVITSVSNGRSLWIATSNNISSLPPELRRRFTLGTFFFDLPSVEERAAIWRIHLNHYGRLWANGSIKGNASLSDTKPDDTGWTGAEIKQCCDIAWRLGCDLAEAAQFVVPVSRSAADQVQRLRSAAEGRFLSASYPGVYRMEREDPEAIPKRRRILAGVE